MPQCSFEKYIASIVKDEELFEFIPEIITYFKEIELKKNELFVKQGAVCQYFCYIENGILQHATEVNSEEKTTYLGLKNSCTSALKSFFKATPSRKNIRALSNCKLRVINIENFNYLLKNNKAFYVFYHNLVELQIFLIDDHRIDLLTLSAEERYQKLLKTEPTLLQEIPLHYLASFLGISTRHMSRIRKNTK